MLKVILAATVLVSLVGCDHARSGECLLGRREALERGSFSGPIVCSSEDATFVMIGEVDGYSLYDYRYRYMPPHGAVMHGGQKVVMFKGAKYAGQYVLSPPPYANVSVKGSKVFFQTDGYPGVSVVDFSNGPPSQISSGGYDSSLFH